jgi:hypothetical protein
MQDRIYTGSGANTEFRSERVSLSTIARFPDTSIAYAELYYHPWVSSNGLYLESAYYDSALADGRVRVGKGRRMTFGITPAYPNRKTSNYGLVTEAVSQDRIQGIQYMYDKGNFNAGLSVHSGYRLGYRSIGDIPGDDIHALGNVVPHLALRDPVSGNGTPGQVSRNFQVSGRVGGKWKGLTAGISGSVADMDARDLANLRTVSSTNQLSPLNPLTGTTPTTPLGASFTDNGMQQLGFDMTWKHPSGFVAQGEYYPCKVSNLNYNVWDVLAGYEWKSGWKVFGRYSKQDMDTPRTDNPLSWDTNQISISVVQPWKKTVWLQYEYEINGEATNTGASVDNNVFFVELFTGF